MPMTSEIIMFAVAVAIAGAISGVMAGLFGIGGGAILVPVFYYIFTFMDVTEAVRMHLALGTSLAIIVPTSIRSFYAHKKRGAVDMQLLKDWIIAVPMGTFLASTIAAYASSGALRLIFACIALVLALRMIFNRESWKLGDDLPKNPYRFFIGSGIGVLSGLMGVGGGIVNNTFMTLYGRPIHQAVATSAGLGVLVSLPGLVGYVLAGWGTVGLPPFSTGFVNWIAVVLIIPITLYTAPIGARLAHAMSKQQLERAFGVFLVFIALQFFYSVYAG